jgi:hypothetical protein
MSAISKQALLVDNNESFPNNNSGQITPSDLRAFNVNVIDSTVNQTEYTTNSGSWNVSISNTNAFTASQQPSFTALNSFTASQLGINTGVNSFTQSATGRLNNLESTTSSLNAWSSSINEIRDNGILQGYSTRLFFEGLVSASIVTNVGGNIATINIEQDGTKLNTSSFNSYTASNNQSFNSYTASTNQRIDSLEVFSGSAKISISALNAFTNSVGPIQTGSLLNTASYSGTTITYTKGDSTTFTNVGIQNTASFNSYTASTDSRLTNIETTTASLNISVSNLNGKTGSYATTGSNTFVGDQTISASLFVSGNTNVGFLNIADLGGINLAGTGSGPITSYGIVTNPSNGDLVFNTNPNNGRLMTFSQTTGKMTQFNGLYFNAGDGNSTNGGIDFSTYSGSLFLTPSGFSSTTASMLHVSSSSNLNNVNLIFKNSNTAADTIVSGSNNIFTNPAAATAGFKRYVGGASNIFTAGASVPQISGSMAWSPSMNGNIFSQTQQAPFTWKGPVSSSASAVNHNILMGGTITLGLSPTLSAEKATAGINMLGNALFNGNINFVASKTTLPAAATISGNLLFGGTTNINANSSSIQYASNIGNGSVTVNNNSTIASGSIIPSLTPRVTLNTLYGVGHVVDLVGENVSTTQVKHYYANFLAGAFLSSSVGAGDSSNIIGTGIIGNSLIVSGSSTVAASNTPLAPNNTYGSLFVGRFNSIDGTKDMTAETVFAVGTGTAAARKTGFLIDSGSNTFVEGTLNVSGSSTFTGSIATSGSVVGNVVSMSIVSSTASMDLNSGNFFTLTLVSGSATHLAASNIKAGQTINLLVSQPTIGTGSLTFNSTFDWPSAISYSATTNTGSKDIISFISFDSSILYGTAVKNLQ